MKKLLPLALALMLALSACTQPPAETTVTPTTDPIPTAEPTLTVTPAVTRETFPRLDGSTATVPLGQAVAAVLLGESREEVSDLIRFNKTSRAYYNLVDGEADLLIVAEGGEDSYAYRDKHRKTWRMEPIAAETLVFFVNEDNPVEGLTLDQVRKIYSGEITNWSQVGGSDSPIQAYQRPQGGGSQAIMDKEIMKGLPMMEPANADYIVSSMEGIIEAVRAWDNQPDALGYTVYYYAHDMGMADGLKLLTIDGVYPSDHTIRSGEYPVHTYYYAVMDSSKPEDSPTARLFDWLLSQEGQDLIAHEGYVSMLEPSATDWSWLDPYEVPAAQYTRRYEGFTDTLIPSDDYGPLVPFAGGTLTTVGDRYGYDWEEYLYGLVTLDGEVVADPVFSQVSPLYSRDASGFVVEPTSVYLLTRTVMDDDGTPTARTALCAKDGSWCTDFLYTYDWEDGWNVNCRNGYPIRKANAGLALVDLETGAELWSVDLSPYMENPSYFYYEQDQIEGYVTVTLYNWETNLHTALCISPAGEVHLLLSGDNVSAGVYGEGLIPVWDGSRYGYMDLTATWVISPAYEDAWPFENGSAMVKSTTVGGYFFIDPTGLSVYDPIPANYAERYGNYWYFTDPYSAANPHNVVAVYDTYGHPVDSPLLNTWLESGIFHAGEGWVVAQANTETLLVRGKEVLSFPATLGQLYEMEGDRLFFYVSGKNHSTKRYTFTDLQGNVLTQREVPTGTGSHWMAIYLDGITGKSYPYLRTDGTDDVTYLDWDGQPLFPARTGWGALYNGYLLQQSDFATTLTSPDGEVVFCWPLVDVTD